MESRIRQKFYQQQCLSYVRLWPAYVYLLGRHRGRLDVFHARFVDCVKNEITRMGKAIGGSKEYRSGYDYIEIRDLIEVIKARGGVPPAYLKRRLQSRLLEQKRETERLLILVQFSHWFGGGNWHAFWNVFQKYLRQGVLEADVVLHEVMTSALIKASEITDKEVRNDSWQGSSRLRGISASRGLSTSAPEIRLSQSQKSIDKRVHTIVQLIETKLNIH